MVLAHALVGMAEGISRHALTDPDGPHGPTSSRRGSPSSPGSGCAACAPRTDVQPSSRTSMVTLWPPASVSPTPPEPEPTHVEPFARRVATRIARSPGSNATNGMDRADAVERVDDPVHARTRFERHEVAHDHTAGRHPLQLASHRHEPRRPPAAHDPATAPPKSATRSQRGSRGATAAASTATTTAGTHGVSLRVRTAVLVAIGEGAVDEHEPGPVRQLAGPPGRPCQVAIERERVREDPRNRPEPPKWYELELAFGPRRRRFGSCASGPDGGERGGVRESGPPRGQDAASTCRSGHRSRSGQDSGLPGSRARGRHLLRERAFGGLDGAQRPGGAVADAARAREECVATALATTAAIVFAAAPLAAAPKESPRKAPTGRAFYLPPDPLPAGAPGKLIWSAPFKAIPGAQAWKVLYHSQALDGSDIAVSGVVVAPTDAAPAGGRPVISWAHGTHGIADQCAPLRRADMVSLAAFDRQGRVAGLRRRRHRLRGSRHAGHAPLPRR